MFQHFWKLIICFSVTRYFLPLLFADRKWVDNHVYVYSHDSGLTHGTVDQPILNVCQAWRSVQMCMAEVLVIIFGSWLDSLISYVLQYWWVTCGLSLVLFLYHKYTGENFLWFLFLFVHNAFLHLLVCAMQMILGVSENHVLVGGQLQCRLWTRLKISLSVAMDHKNPLEFHICF